MDDIDRSMSRLEVFEILVSEISGDQFRILRKVKAHTGRHSDDAVIMANRLVAGAVGRMDDQEPTTPAELVVEGANDGAIQGGDAVGLVPTICCDQHLAPAVGVTVHTRSLVSGGPPARQRETHAAVASA